MTNTRTRAAQLLLLSCCFVAITAIAGEKFPGQVPDRSVIKTQEKVDSLVERGKYERALIIYRHELAPLGDKYAQYMIGFMHLAGKGVDEDVATAAAWYRLAAERQQQTFVNEHAKLWSLLNNAQQQRADQIYVDLRTELGDAALIANLIEGDLQALGNRIRENPFSQDTVSRSNFDRQETINERMVNQIRARMDYLQAKLETDPAVIEVERQRLKQLEARVEREIEAFEASR